jgi:hypothetical protein
VNIDYFKNIDVPFDALTLPSMGHFYSSGTATLYVKYITAREENILTQPSLMENGYGLELVMESVIINKDFPLDELLVGDKQSMLVYLRSTSYGDNFPIATHCPNCSTTGETKFELSSLPVKEVEEKPDENGFFNFTMPKMKLNGEKVYVKFEPMRLKHEKEINLAIEEEKKSNKAYNSNVTLKFQKQIHSINGITDKDYIKKVIKKFPIKDSTELREYMEKVEPGIDSNIKIVCQNCSHEYTSFVYIDNSIFSLDPSYKSNLWEEIFLIWYYGKGVNRSDIYNMSTVERRWSLQRISEEIEKRNQAEQSAADKAKRG